MKLSARYLPSALSRLVLHHAGCLSRWIAAIGLLFAGTVGLHASATTAHLLASLSTLNSPLASTPYGLATDAQGNLYVSYFTLGSIWRFTAIRGEIPSDAVPQQLVSGLTEPNDLTFDRQGNLLISGPDSIKMLAAVGGRIPDSPAISTVASGLTTVTGLAVDAAGDIFFAQTTTGSLHKIAAVSGTIPANPTVTVIASGLNWPCGIDIDSSGNIYVAMANAGTIVEMLAVGGTVPANPSMTTVVPGISFPNNVRVDGNGNLIISGYGSATNKLLSFNPGSGITSTLASNYTGFGIAVDAASGHIYYLPSVRQAQIGVVSTRSVNFEDLPVAATTPASRTLTFAFDTPGSIAAPSVMTQGSEGLDFTDAGTGSCTTNGTSHSYAKGDTCTVDVTFAPRYPGQRRGAVVLKDGSGDSIATAYIYGTGTGPQAAFTPGTVSNLNTGNTTLNAPYQAAFDGAGNMYVTDSNSNKVFKIPAGGGDGVAIPVSGVSLPTGIAVDGAGNLFIADYNNSRILVVPASGTAGTLAISGLPSAPSHPTSLKIDGSGVLYIADYGNTCIDKVVLNGVSLSTGSPTGTGSVVSTPGYSFSSSSMLDLAVDSAGTLYAGDRSANRVLKITADGQASVLATGSVTLSVPAGIAVDAGGSVYIADQHARIVKVSSSGITTVIPVSSLGAYPMTLTLDPGGNILIADFGNVVRILDRSAAANSLTFPATNIGSTSVVKTITLDNIGSEALSFPIPSSGNNPSIASDFSLNSTGGTACPLTGSTTSAPGLLSAGTDCTLDISFAPTAAGPVSGSLVLTDNHLNASPSTTHTIALSGTGLAPLTATTAVASSTLTVGHAATTFTPVTGAGGTAPLAYSAAPALPPGLSLNSSTGAISGTPTALSSQTTYTITVTDSTAATATDTFSLQVVTLAADLTLPSPGTHTYGDAPFGVTATSSSTGALSYSVVSGPATVMGSTVTITGAGNVTLRVDQDAAGGYPAASTTASFTIQPAALTVTANDATRVYGGANPAFVGMVTGAKNNESFTTSFTTTATATSPVGSYTVTPAVTGATLNNYAVFTSNGTLTVTKAATGTTLALGSTSATPLQTVVLTAAVASATSGTPTGTVTFLDNGAALGTAAVSGGVATYSGTFASGSHVISASYAGDGNFLGSASSTTGSTITVASQDFSFTGPSTTQVYTGTSVAVSYQLAPVNGAYPGPVTFSVTGLPTGATWTTTTTSLAANAGPQTVTLLIKLPAAAVVAGLHDRRGLPLSFALLLLPLAGVRRMRWATGRLGRVLFAALLLAGTVVGVGSLTGCGSGSTAQAATNYNVTVTATAGSVQRTSQLTLSVMNSN
ncbi:MAG: Ig-like domain repeat protein [Edaphobacter sp.]|uniref:Ig-like domain repeat protein n=1 Tax=Edaphobacter sp. TaxID=1934404 RepID=UPI002394BE64|nr:Ig-like domain repeat protein [Edaphobacter sp.]MDE1175041.1 Ig-like domain repeat protein [Edaphobacter sp.]